MGTPLEDIPDISLVPADITIPELSAGEPSAGKRVKQSLLGWSSLDTYHVLYLPTNWRSDQSYPVIVEYMGNGGYSNEFGDGTEGWPEESKMGYGIGSGRDFIWLCLPYLDGEGKAPVARWWGSPPDYNVGPTVAYAKKTVPRICQQYGGDPARVLLAGFSRGAIACNFIGLYNDEIARLWRAFVPFSHYDGVRSWDFAQGRSAAARDRLRRLGGRPQFICEEGDGKRLEQTRRYLARSGIAGDFTFALTGFRNHNDAWLLRPSPARDHLRSWVKNVMTA